MRSYRRSRREAGDDTRCAYRRDPHRHLNEATYLALEGMLDLMHEQYGYGRQEALALASLTVDLRITRIVNGVRGVHAVLPHGAIHTKPI